MKKPSDDLLSGILMTSGKIYKNRGYLLVSLYNKDETIVNILKEYFGGNIYIRKNGYDWRIKSRQLKELIIWAANNIPQSNFLTVLLQEAKRHEFIS
jgi:exosome complex RNA-binding protein Rrp4